MDLVEIRIFLCGLVGSDSPTKIFPDLIVYHTYSRFEHFFSLKIWGSFSSITCTWVPYIFLEKLKTWKLRPRSGINHSGPGTRYSGPVTLMNDLNSFRNGTVPFCRY
jgi:hypothetical protein